MTSEEPVETLYMPDLPARWVTKLVLPREAFDVRCPRGAKVTNYKKCQHEIFAMFGECAQWNGLVSRLTVYTSNARTMVEGTARGVSQEEGQAARAHHLSGEKHDRREV